MIWDRWQLKKGIRIAAISLVAFCFGPALLWGACRVSAVGASFGSYSPFDTAAVTSTGTITIDCGVDTSHVIVAIGPSQSSGGFNPRQMRGSGSNLMNYNLYTASDLTVIWGDGTQGTSTQFFNIKKNKKVDALVYGSIPAAQDVGLGSYSESLLVTINF